MGIKTLDSRSTIDFAAVMCDLQVLGRVSGQEVGLLAHESAGGAGGCGLGGVCCVCQATHCGVITTCQDCTGLTHASCHCHNNYLNN